MLQLQGPITQYEGNILATKMNNIKAGLSNPEGTWGLNINISSPTVDNNGNLSQQTNSDRKFNFSDPQMNSLQDKQSAEIQAIDQNYTNDRSKVVAAHTTEIRSEYIGTNAYRVLKSWKFDTITPTNMEKAKELLIASQNRLNNISQDRPGYQDMLSRTETLRKNISNMELKQTEAMLKDTLKWLV